MDAVLPFRAMARNNAWANHRLLNACAKLSRAELEAPRIGFFPSLRATLNHILIVDRFYVDALEGGTLGPAAWADREPCETAALLQVAQSEVDRRLIAVVEQLAVADLDRIVDVHRGERIQRERLDRLLLHLFQHQIHHRGQAHAMLSATEIAPPQLDEFFSVAEAPLRAEEFAALGWSEETVWATRPNLMAAEPQLFVTDMAVSCDFYVRRLGFRIEFQYGEPPFYAQVVRDGARLNLRHVDGPVYDSGFRSSERDALSATITLDEATALFQEFRAARVPFHHGLRTEPWGAQTFIVRDPDGNLIAFASPEKRASTSL